MLSINEVVFLISTRKHLKVCNMPFCLREYHALQYQMPWNGPNITPAVVSLLLVALTSFIRIIFLECLGRKPNWFSNKILCLFKNEMQLSKTSLSMILENPGSTEIAYIFWTCLYHLSSWIGIPLAIFNWSGTQLLSIVKKNVKGILKLTAKVFFFFFFVCFFFFYW